MAAQVDQPAGTTRAGVPFGDHRVHVTTGSGGAFGVAVADPNVSSDPSEFDRRLTGAPTMPSNPFSPGDLEVDFMDVTVAHVSIGGESPITIGGHVRTPGRPAEVGDVVVENAAHQLLTDVPVTISVDHGYLTPSTSTSPAQLTPAVGNQVEGGKIGEWKSLGDSVTISTADGPVGGGSGRGRVSDQVAEAIGRDAAFDDDGQVTTRTTATAAGHSDTDPITWSSSDPLNPGEVKLAFGDGNVSRILPKAHTGLSVNLDLTTTDQFGNRLDQSTTVTDDTTSASVNSPATGQFTGDGEHVHATASAAGEQNITAKWSSADTNTWHFVPGSPGHWTMLGGSEDVTGAAPKITWYEVDLAASKYTMKHTGGSLVAPGGAVTETYTAIDQMGQPISGMQVDFFRAGPDKLQDGNAQQYNHTTDTDANGKAQYVFQGTTGGTAHLTGVMYDSLDHQVQASHVADTVKFGTPAPTGGSTVSGPPQPTLILRNWRRGDRLIIESHTSANAGALVAIYKRHHHKWIRVRFTRLDRNGVAKVTLKDHNGRRFTKYVARVGATANTPRMLTNVARVR